MNRRGFLAILAGAPIAAKMAPSVMSPLTATELWTRGYTGGISQYIKANAWDLSMARPTEKDFNDFLEHTLRFDKRPKDYPKHVPVSERWMEELNRGTFD